MKRVPALISVHDVMPETLDDVDELLAGCLAALPPERVVLLVVPGRRWQAYDIDRLRRWQNCGYELAGHGWQHCVKRVSTLYHRLHRLLVSRDAAEHLSLGESEVRGLVAANAEWFECNRLAPPDLYVPPAWAMGRLSPRLRERLPFRYYESTAGISDDRLGVFTLLPLAGFEADCRWRALFLNVWNRLNRLIASPRRPLRIAIHPGDHRHLLHGMMNRWLSHGISPINYRDVASRGRVQQPQR